MIRQSLAMNALAFRQRPPLRLELTRFVPICSTVSRVEVLGRLHSSYRFRFDQFRKNTGFRMVLMTETKMQIKEFWVNRQQFRDIKVVMVEAPPIADGEVRVAVDRCALTANNISYLVSGEAIGYWGYFPAAEGWGKIPVWGFADVVESRCEALPVGERIWGFFPIASHLTLVPGNVTPADFIDFAPHRRELPALYNKYQRTAAEPAMLRRFEDERSLFFPLFATSWILYDYLIDNKFFGAQQIVIASVSSKTAFGLACMLHG
ncbi:MAG: DUF2855 family protein, partial [Betaproteobacteria bacterium]|nr:DUF2855 family protein [Betaproteobacteria bacterium]